jgi:glycoside/pentoside/hexuronide:cation symporter, GPH family
MQEPERYSMKQPLDAESLANSRTSGLHTATPKAGSAPFGERLSMGTKLLYGAPNLAAGAMAIPILINMPKFYADVVAVPLAYLAVAIAATRCLDAIIDPSIGLISDRTRTRWGRRRPYIFAGAPLGGLAFWALMSPPQYLTGFGGVVWFTATSMLCSFFLTIALLPHSALGAELSLDYQERNSLFGAREGFGVLGTIVAAAAPGFLMQRFGWSDRVAFSRLGLDFMIGLVATCWLMVAFVHERPEFSRQPPNPLVPGVRRALRNRPFRILLASYVAGTIGAGMGPILLPFFISYVVQPVHPALWLSIILLAYLGIGFMFIPVGVFAARRWGKLPTLTVCYLIGISVGVLIFLLVGKGDTGRFLLLVGIGATAFGVSGFLPPSMQAEVIDYDELHTGRRREAQYAGFWSILPKLAAIPGAALPIALLASLGYAPNAVQRPEVVHAIRILYGLGPAIAAVASLAIVSRFPINAENHALILGGIERHKRGEEALDPLSGRELPPPAAEGTDDASAWFLDNFSQHELERFIARGSRSALSDVWRSAALSLAACLISGWVAMHRIGSAGDPGAIASLGVVVSGFALTLFLFHLMRIGPARRLTTGAIPQTVVRAHLENCRQGCI